MYKLGNKAQAFLPGNRKLPDYMKGECDICYLNIRLISMLNLSSSQECRLAWVYGVPGFFLCKHLSIDTRMIVLTDWEYK